MTDLLIARPVLLARGAALKTRLAKSALSEALGSTDNRVTPELIRLYKRWSESGAGLLLTGNVMVDRRAGQPLCARTACADARRCRASHDHHDPTHGR